jgi:hypothetical protein
LLVWIGLFAATSAISAAGCSDDESPESSGADSGTDTDSDTDTGPQPSMIECDGGLYDSTTDLCWQHPAEHECPFAEISMEGTEFIARSYCSDLVLGGHEDWRLPSIDELRSLIRGCPSTEPGGECAISEDSDCLTMDCAEECGGCEGGGGCYWDPQLGEFCPRYWSSSECEPNMEGCAWHVSFVSGAVDWMGIEGAERVRCVRDGT